MFQKLQEKFFPNFKKFLLNNRTTISHKEEFFEKLNSVGNEEELFKFINDPEINKTFNILVKYLRKYLINYTKSLIKKLNESERIDSEVNTKNLAILNGFLSRLDNLAQYNEVSRTVARSRRPTAPRKQRGPSSSIRSISNNPTIKEGFTTDGDTTTQMNERSLKEAFARLHQSSVRRLPSARPINRNTRLQKAQQTNEISGRPLPRKRRSSTRDGGTTAQMKQRLIADTDRVEKAPETRVLQIYQIQLKFNKEEQKKLKRNIQVLTEALNRLKEQNSTGQSLEDVLFLEERLQSAQKHSGETDQRIVAIKEQIEKCEQNIKRKQSELQKKKQEAQKILKSIRQEEAALSSVSKPSSKPVIRRQRSVATTGRRRRADSSRGISGRNLFSQRRGSQQSFQRVGTVRRRRGSTNSRPRNGRGSTNSQESSSPSRQNRRNKVEAKRSPRFRGH